MLYPYNSLQYLKDVKKTIIYDYYYDYDYDYDYDYNNNILFAKTSLQILAIQSTKKMYTKPLKRKKEENKM